MSCETLNTTTTSFSVSVASLPEGFCPTTMQELANAIAGRLLVNPNQDFNSFAIGSIEPSSNVGPWLKDCLEWFVFDDATARYIPIQRGFDSFQYFDTAGAGSFIVPANVYRIKYHAWGGGGGGSNTTGGATGSGGGGGGYGLTIATVIPGQTVAFVIGAAGANGAAGTNGGATTILTGTAGGGLGAPSATESGDGGAATGFDVNMAGQGGMANGGSSTGEGGCNGGDAGGWGGKGGAVKTIALSRPGTSPGGGGSGGANNAGSAAGSGAAGGVLIEY